MLHLFNTSLVAIDRDKLREKNDLLFISSLMLWEAGHFPSTLLDDATHMCVQTYVIKPVSAGLTFVESPVWIIPFFHTLHWIV